MLCKKKTFQKIEYTFGFLFNGIFSLLFQNIFAFFQYYFNCPNFLFFCIVASNFQRMPFSENRKKEIVVSTATELTK